MGYEDNDAEFAVYINIVVVEGEVIGGVFSTQAEALDDARNMVAEFEGLNAEDNGTLDALTAGALEERLNEQDVVGFVMVAERQVLFS
jgi:hypothetical protein